MMLYKAYKLTGHVGATVGLSVSGCSGHNRPRPTASLYRCSYLLWQIKIIKTYKILHGIYDITVFLCLSRCQFSGIRGNNFKLVKHYCRYMIFENTLSFKELLRCKICCYLHLC